jgi:hypothetical protein
MADYSKQLQEIAAGLSRPSTPSWVVAIISSIVGFVSALLLQFVQARLAERFKRDRLRRVLYVDLAEIFGTVESIMDPSEMDASCRWVWQKEQLKLHVGFKGEQHLRANEDTYMEMAERATANCVYTYFHMALGDLDHWWNVNWSIARQVFATAVYEDVLKRKYFDKYVGKEEAERLWGRCRAIHESSQQGLKAMEDQGTQPSGDGV